MRSITDPTKKQTPQERKKAEMLASGKFVEGDRGELIRVQEESMPVGLPSDERIRELEMLDRPMTEMEAREYALRAFDPSATPNQAFSLVAGLGFDPVGQLANKVLGSLASKFFGKSASEAAKIQAARKEMAEGFSERMGLRRAEEDLARRRASEHLDYKLDQLLRRAQADEAVDVNDLFLQAQGLVDDMSGKAIRGEAQKILNQAMKDDASDIRSLQSALDQVRDLYKEFPNTVFKTDASGVVSEGTFRGIPMKNLYDETSDLAKKAINSRLNQYGGRLGR